MSYIVVDVFEDQQQASVRAEAYRQSGKNVVLETSTEGITANDCRTDPCTAKLDADGAPLYIIIASD
ncbi:hypothetical protein [Desulfovibrio ferrophilus]|uniref:Uncharacterized protein n=1 Tax=Desulfovibrio ferrophilus TaxID=241368 RepID=A0A2Z6AXA0_9BACT|nr:hypothetical protein [Desulfovibrio ferrophilus]BBD07776.1 uncharacterized protein DFE_1050 [Desulfovibrio ferrophilus]